MSTNPLDALRALSPFRWPAHAPQILLDALRHRGAGVRHEAAQIAWHAMNDEVALTLVDLLRDPSPAVAGAAAITLGAVLEEHDAPSEDEAWARVGAYTTTSRTTFARIGAALQDAWDDPTLPDPVRRCVLEAAAHAPQPWLDRAIRVALVREGEGWRATGMFCAGLMPGFEEDILEGLDDPDPQVFHEALRAAGGRGMVETEARLLQVARSEEEDEELRRAAIEALGKLPPAVDAAASTQAFLEELAAQGDDLGFVAAAALEQRSLQAALDRWGALDLP